MSVEPEAPEARHHFSVEVTTIQGRVYVTEWSSDSISEVELNEVKGSLGNVLAKFELLSLTETVPNYFFRTTQIEAITVRTQKVVS